MARLPTAEELGGLPSAVSGRPIATYDIGGYARGATAMAEGLSNLGKGIGKAAESFSERNRLDRAKADANLQVAAKALRQQAGDEADPDALTANYPQAFRQAQASAALSIEDPGQRRLWSLERAADVDGHIVQTLDDAAALRKRREVEDVTGQLETLKTTALGDADEVSRTKAIDTGNDLIFGLRGTGAIDEAQARAMRESWVTSYATSQLTRQPPEDRIKALDSGEGMAAFLPEDQRGSLKQAAQADVLDAQRQAQSDAGLARFTTYRDIADDIAKMTATGRGRDDLSPRRIDDTLGPEARRAWQAQRDDAFTIWRATHDFSTLTDAEIEARVAGAAPKNGEAGEGATPAPDTAVSSRQQAIYDQVRARADAIRLLRLANPAASVADDPNVKAAQQAFDPQKPETVQALIDARLAAQQRAGIEKPTVATLAEIKELIRPLYEAVKADVETQGGNPDLVETAQADLIQRIEQTYGSYTNAVMDELARQMGLAGRVDTSDESQGQNEGGFDRRLVEPVQYRVMRPRVFPGPVAPPLMQLTPQQGREASEFFERIPGRLRSATEALRNWIIHQSGDQEDKRNTQKPEERPESAAPAASPPPEQEPDKAAAAAAEAAANIARQSKRVSGVALPDNTTSGGLSSALSKEYVDKSPVTPEEKQRLTDLIQSGASPSEIAADPAVERAREKQKSYPPTTLNPGYGTPDYEKTREFDINGQRVQGYDAAVEHLLDVARAKDKRKVEKQFIAVIVTGPPASGKSTVANEIALRIGAAIPDPDDAKELIPEYRGGIGANAVHLESVRLYGRVLDELTDDSENVVIPIVGHTAEWTREIARYLDRKGYTLSLVNLTVEPDEAYRRMIRRFAETGRLIDHDYFTGIGNRPRDNYYQLKTEGLFDQAADYDANGSDLRLLEGQDAYRLNGVRMVR